jgi:hypothetical protein
MMTNEIRDLLNQLHDGSISPENFQRLNSYLERPAGQKELVDDLGLEAALIESFQSQPKRASILGSEQQKALLKLKRSIGSWASLAAGIAICIGCFALYRAQRDGLKDRRFPYLVDAATVIRDQKKLALAAGSELHPGDEVLSTSTNIVDIRWNEEATSLALSPASTLRLESFDIQKKISLLNGMVTADVADQPVDHPLLIGTRHAEAQILGTRIRMNTAENQTSMRVEQGSVLVSCRALDEGTLVESFEEWQVTDDNAVDHRRISPADSLPIGLIAHWKLDEAAGEVLVNEVSSELQAFHHAQRVDEGQSGRAIKFDSKSSSESRFIETNIKQLPGIFSVSLWLKPASTINEVAAIMTNSKAGTREKGIRLLINHGQSKVPQPVFTPVIDYSLNLQTGTGTTGLAKRTGPNFLVPDQWQHLAVVFDRNRLRAKVFHNGKAYKEELRIFPYPDSELPLQFGGLPGPGDHPGQYEGLMDEIRFYDRALEPVEVRYLHTNDPQSGI